MVIFIIQHLIIQIIIFAISAEFGRNFIYLKEVINWKS
ncbi:hypothetical protein SpAn4DRAFT_3942 [Sporomusa ovata]|uniref:Uncharacterized protein n=1 Tax=Sporomusa ovata TaxID=2378 RepID=A0A0U1KVH3_9FIRM|nr:hypothetical protein SpAn4DRAFT_3942 [Sporomusa ovata]